MDDDPCRILEVAPDASQDEIHQAYAKLVRRYPPELNPERFSRFHQAYQQLTSLEHRLQVARRQPEKTIRALFPLPRVALRPPPSTPPPPEPPNEAEFEPLWGPLRRTLLCELLRRELGGER